MVSTKTKRGFTVLKFQRQCFDKFGWLHYHIKSGKVFCHTCITAITRGFDHLERDHETNFLMEGFFNWKKSMQKFKQHESSHLHELCILKLQAASQKPVTAQFKRPRFQKAGECPTCPRQADYVHPLSGYRRSSAQRHGERWREVQKTPRSTQRRR